MLAEMLSCKYKTFVSFKNYSPQKGQTILQKRFQYKKNNLWKQACASYNKQTHLPLSYVACVPRPWNVRQTDALSEADNPREKILWLGKRVVVTINTCQHRNNNYECTTTNTVHTCKPMLHNSYQTMGSAKPIPVKICTPALRTM